MEKTANNKIIDSNYKIILKGTAISITMTILLLFIFAILLVNTNLKDSTIKPIVIVLSSISIFIGSSISTIKIRKNGMLYGGLVGAIYIVLIYLLSSIAFAGFSLNLSSLVMIISSIMTGVVGGVIGVNIK